MYVICNLRRSWARAGLACPTSAFSPHSKGLSKAPDPSHIAGRANDHFCLSAGTVRSSAASPWRSKTPISDLKREANGLQPCKKNSQERHSQADLSAS